MMWVGRRAWGGRVIGEGRKEGVRHFNDGELNMAMAMALNHGASTLRIAAQSKLRKSLMKHALFMG